jgi:hypothetical protein
MIMAYSQAHLKKPKRKSQGLTADSRAKNFTGQLADFQNQRGQAMQFVPRWKITEKGEYKK